MAKIMAANYLTLSQLMGAVEDTVAGVFSGYEFTFIAETGDIKNYPDRQYCFFNLVEKKNGETLAKADAVIWRSHYPLIRRFETATGKKFEKSMQVLFRGEITFHSVFGLRIRITHIDESYTLGLIEKERQDVLNRLLTEYARWVQLENGEYISANRRLPLPTVIQRIALITAPDSDGLRDFMHELENNSFGYRFHVTPFLTRVQGKEAEKEIENVLRLAAAQANHFDAAVLVRGGGSELDLGPFDCLDPATSIASFPIPVITGIGHERNVSVADLMSHTRVKTPTKAASFIIEHNAEFENRLEESGRIIMHESRRQLQHNQRSLDKLWIHLFSKAEQHFLKQNHVLDSLEQQIKSRDPRWILSLGYSLVRRSGKLISSADILSSGEQVDIEFKDGTVSAKITPRE
jgi:exodeoxyribonuclease VII large subunit